MTGRDRAGEHGVVPESNNENLNYRPSEAAEKIESVPNPGQSAVPFVPLLHMIANY